MSLTTTTLSSACGLNDKSIVVASATGFAAGYFVLIDGELMRVSKEYTSGTTIPLDGRGLNGTPATAHPATANVVVGVASDWSGNATGQAIAFPVKGQTEDRKSYSASGAITLPTPGNNMLAILNGTSVLAMTIAAPTKDMDGCELTIVSNGAAAHTLTFAGGLSGAGSAYDVITINASAPAAFKVVACNGNWLCYCGPAMGGTVTNIIGSVA